MATILERFEAKINKETESGCWEWTAYLDSKGYGAFRYEGKTRRAHRVSWMIYKGDIPKGNGYHGTCVLHKCDNRRCVNPEHLFLGSNQDNMLDMVSKGRGITPNFSGEKNGMFDHTPYTFKNKKKGWKIKCTQYYLRTTFNLYQGNLSDVVLNKLKSTGGWELIKGEC